MRIGVTGGSGFIGSYICEQLTAAGATVVVLDAKRPPDTTLDWIEGDIRHPADVAHLAADCEAIIHLAGLLGTPEMLTNPAAAVETNVIGGLNVLEAAAGSPVVILGIGNWFMDNAYAISKHTVERFARMFNLFRGGRITIVRPVTAYGPRQLAPFPFGPAKVRKIVPSFVTRALAGWPIETYFGGGQVSDLVYAGDVARVVIAAATTLLDSGAPASQVIEVGPTESNTVLDVANAVIRLCVERGYKRVPVYDLGDRPGEEPGMPITADVATLKEIGVDPAGFVSLIDGLERTIDWYIANARVTWWPKTLAKGAIHNGTRIA